ncbi:MAG: TraB/GumN family protein [Oscillospiraceae bacterium]|nr:TraB/GumN family protein [Oscillospiraceae bacterium]
MRKIIALILCALMLLSMAACKDTQTPEAPAQPEATPEPTPDPVELALEVYTRYAEDAAAAENSQFLIESVTTRSVGDVGYDEKVTEKLVYQDMGSSSPLVLRDRKQVYYGKNSYSEYLYADGYAYTNGLYKAETTLEDFLADIYPVALITPELYKSKKLDGAELILSAPTAAEPWLGEGIVFMDAEARIIFNDTVTEVVSVEYEGEYMSNHVLVELSLSMTPQEKDAETDLKEEIPLSNTLKPIPDMYVPELFNKASVAVQNSDAKAIALTSYYDISALDIELTDATEAYIHGSGDDISMYTDYTVTYREGRNVGGYYISESYRDGIYRYSQNGETYEQVMPAGNLDLSTYTYNELTGTRFSDNFEITYLDGYILIDFQIDLSLGDGAQQSICRAVFGDPLYLDFLASDFETISYTGYLAFDADTMLPCAYATDFHGAHTINGKKKDVRCKDLVSYDLLSAEAAQVAAGIEPEEPEPEESATPLFYKVTGESGQTMWLLGTIHVGDERTAYLPESIYKAMDQSHALALEVDTEAVEQYLAENADVMKAMQEKMYYLDGTTIDQKIDPELYSEAKNYLKAIGAYDHNADSGKPTVWASRIETAFMFHVGQLSSDYGVEERLIKEAKDRSMEIWSIEDMAEHLMVTLNFSEGLQELLLYETVSYGRAEYAAELMELYELWCDGDEEALREQLRVSEDIEFTEEELEMYTPEELAEIEGYIAEYNQAIAVQRDELMLEKAIEYLESGNTVFYAVGLAHLLSETGLVDGLREAGYTVEIVK